MLLLQSLSFCFFLLVPGSLAGVCHRRGGHHTNGYESAQQTSAAAAINPSRSVQVDYDKHWTSLGYKKSSPPYEPALHSASSYPYEHEGQPMYTPARYIASASTTSRPYGTPSQTSLSLSRQLDSSTRPSLQAYSSSSSLVSSKTSGSSSIRLTSSFPSSLSGRSSVYSSASTTSSSTLSASSSFSPSGTFSVSTASSSTASRSFTSSSISSWITSSSNVHSSGSSSSSLLSPSSSSSIVSTATSSIIGSSSSSVLSTSSTAFSSKVSSSSSSITSISTTSSAFSTITSAPSSSESRTSSASSSLSISSAMFIPTPKLNNPDFETGNSAGWREGFNKESPGTVTFAVVSCAPNNDCKSGSYYYRVISDRFVDSDGFSAGVSQSLSLVIGQRYTVTMWTKGVAQWYCSYGFTTLFADRGSADWMFRNVTFTADQSNWDFAIVVSNTGGIVTDARIDAITIALA